MTGTGTKAVLGLLAGVVLAFTGCSAIAMVGAAGIAQAGECALSDTPTAPSLLAPRAASTVPTVEGFTAEQVGNAASIVDAATAMQLPERASAIGVMTAIWESSLINIGHGDAVGPDSLGLFQQRTSWGTVAERMDPRTAATKFFTALQAVPDWEQLEPTLAAHRVQRNADPLHYAPSWEAATRIVSAITGGGDYGCVPGGAGTVGPDGWALPASGPLASPFGFRVHPITGAVKLHAGADISPKCNTPIYAAQSGTVTKAGAAQGYGNLILIDHGGGVVTGYGHMYNDGVLVREGDVVDGGTQIGLVGSSGGSTGCHLHFEVHQNLVPIDPVPFMAAVGITLGTPA